MLREEERTFLCPITQELMLEPVVAADGVSYERGAIESWFRTRREAGRPLTSPLTGAVLADTALVRRQAESLSGLRL